MEITIKPIGWVKCSESLVAGESKEDYWGDVVSEIRLDKEQFNADATQGLAEFSHVEVLYYFHGVSEDSMVAGVRHPRGNPEWPLVGVFAQRNKARPNRIGATICELVAVDGPTLKVRGLDALNDSPVVDIKPVFAEFGVDPGMIRQPAWSRQLMSKYFASQKLQAP